MLTVIHTYEYFLPFPQSTLSSIELVSELDGVDEIKYRLHRTPHGLMINKPAEHWRTEISWPLWLGIRNVKGFFNWGTKVS